MPSIPMRLDKKSLVSAANKVDVPLNALRRSFSTCPGLEAKSRVAFLLRPLAKVPFSSTVAFHLLSVPNVMVLEDASGFPSTYNAHNPAVPKFISPPHLSCRR